MRRAVAGTLAAACLAAGASVPALAQDDAGAPVERGSVDVATRALTPHSGRLSGHVRGLLARSCDLTLEAVLGPTERRARRLVVERPAVGALLRDRASGEAVLRVAAVRRERASVVVRLEVRPAACARVVGGAGRWQVPDLRFVVRWRR